MERLKTIYRVLLIVAFITMTSMCVNEAAKADYTLVMVMFAQQPRAAGMTPDERRVQFGHEVFIAYSDCRDRGLKNLNLLSTYRAFTPANTHVGFYCQEEGT